MSTTEPNLTNVNLTMPISSKSMPTQLASHKLKGLDLVAFILIIGIAVSSGTAAIILGIPLLFILTALAVLAFSILLYFLLREPKSPISVTHQPTPIIKDTDLPPVPPLALTPVPTEAMLEEPPLPSPRTHQTLLQENWDRIPDLQANTDMPFIAADNQTGYAWHLKNSNLTLISTLGPIEKPRYKTQGIVMIVNAATPNMANNVKGTSLALAKATSVRCWENSKKSPDPLRSKQPLQLGECRSGKWENLNGTTNAGKAGLPQFLGQLLGPKASDYNYNPNDAFTFCRQAYLNCLNEAKRRKTTVVQLPLLSSHFPSSPKDEETTSLRLQWIDGVKLALIDALQTFGSEAENQNQPWVIILTTLARHPLITP
ncbi:conserved hypothetical protein [Chlamydia pneumoniae LPCoLN]|uniref:hypothetical protein n=1 Tax=Chlamydia pneumoniae TaxID=83558 RepID=UPI0001BD9C21|nr:hypothetical protein [Chlamydia pneumoniae]ACZ33345.1 conserved hypothetical protein [Chlamydia pneumoniae LPCoLN]ETR80262.1 Inclusion membrane protein A [Chlamydia pneumoniae B21]